MPTSQVHSGTVAIIESPERYMKQRQPATLGCPTAARSRSSVPIAGDGYRTTNFPACSPRPRGTIAFVYEAATFQINEVLHTGGTISLGSRRMAPFERESIGIIFFGTNETSSC